MVRDLIQRRAELDRLLQPRKPNGKSKLKGEISEAVRERISKGMRAYWADRHRAVDAKGRDDRAA